jgi:CheY-like chemotaxis protein
MLHIMIVDGDPSRVGALTRHLDAGFDDLEIHVSETLEEARWLAAKLDFDVILCVLSLEDATPYEAVAELTRSATSPPVIALADRGDDDQAADMIAAGAQEYLELEQLGERPLARAIKTAIARGEATGARAPVEESIAEVAALKPSGLITTGQWDRVRSGEIAPGVDVLGAVARFTEMMLTRDPAEPFEARLGRALGGVGLLVGASRLSIWELDHGARVANLFGAWSHPGHSIGGESPLMIQSAPFGLLSRDHLTCLRLGGSLELGQDEMTVELERASAVMGAGNMLIVPIMRAGDFWGVITADDRAPRRRWGATIQLLMRTIGRVAATIQRREDFDRSNSDPRVLGAGAQGERVAFETDASGALSMLGDAWHVLTGAQASAALGCPLLAFVDPRDHAQLVDTLVPVSLGQSTTAKVAIRLTSGGGSTTWVELVATARDVGGLSGTLHSVARPEQAEREGASRALRVSARAVLAQYAELRDLADAHLAGDLDETACARLVEMIGSLELLGDRLASTAQDIDSGTGPLRQDLEDRF